MSLSEWLKTFQTRSVRKSHRRPERRLAAELTAVFQSELLEIRTLLTSDFGEAPQPSLTTLVEFGDAPTASGFFATSHDIHTTHFPDISAIADLDGDGDTDLVTVDGGTVSWHENDGTGSLQIHEIEVLRFDLGTFQDASLTVDDVDLDGDADIVLATNYRKLEFEEIGRRELYTFANNGSEVFDTILTRRISYTLSGSGGSNKPAEVTSAVSGDLDNDGTLELIAAIPDHSTDTSYRISVFDSLTGQNSSASHVIDASKATQLDLADLDGDGFLDIIASDYQSGDLWWYENDGTGSGFTEHLIVDSTHKLGGFQLTDFDQDGDIDIVASIVDTSSGSATYTDLTWFENDGSGGLTSHVIGSRIRNLASFAVGDTDGDGDDNIVASRDVSSGPKVVAFRNDEAQGFSYMPVAPDAAFSTQILLGDMDGDGDLDYINGGDRPSWYENESQTGLTHDFGDAPVGYPTWLSEDGARHAASGPTLGATRDAESDGAHSTTASGDGDDEDGVTFSTVQVGAQDVTVTVNVQNAPSGAKLDAWIDFNGDGNWNGADEHVFRNVSVVNGDNSLTFDVPATASVGNTFARFRLSTAGTATPTGASADGEVEDYLIAVTAAETSLTYGSQVVIGTDPNADFNVVAIDLDGDSDVDLITADDGIYWRSNNGNGVFGGQQQIASAGDAPDVRSLTAVDVDGDGDIDILSASFSSDEIVWFENDGSQNFTKRLLSSTVDGAYSVQAADIDGDGDIDIVSAGSRDDSVQWFENDGSQNFTEHTLLADSGVSEFHVNRASVLDIDHDGDLDIINVSGSSRGKNHFRNNGDGTFSTLTGQTLSLGDAFGVTPADLDGDGDTDLVVTRADTDELNWFQNVTNLSFDATDVVLNTSGTGGPDGANSLVVADVDGDGNMDIVATGRLGNSVILYRNDGNQYFTGTTITTSAGSPRQVVVADLNGDGILDIISVSSADHKLAWYPVVNPPVITTPTDLVTADSSFTLNWDAVAGAEGYEVWYTYATTGQAPLIQQTVTTNSFTPSTPLPIGRYFIWVRVRQNDGSTTAWSNSIKVTVAAPVVLNAIDYQQSDTTPTITWDALPGATRYEIWGNNLTTGQSQIISDTNITGTSFTPSSALGIGRYRIWVRGYDAANVASAWSAGQDINLGPQPVGPLNPTFDSRPTFEWTPVPGAASYELYLSTASGVVVQSGLTGTSWTPSSDLPNGTLRWWVRGYNGATPGPWSDRVDSGIGGKPILLTPSGTSGDASPQFTWSPVTGATRYSLYVSRIDVPGLAFRQDTLTTTSFTSSILEDGSYRAWVRAFDGSDSPGLWSSPVNFTVDAATGVLTTSPTSPLTATFDTTPTFTWSTATGASSYDLYLTNGTTVIEQTGLPSPTFTQGSALAIGNWTWWVRAVDGSSNPGPWSNPSSLHIGGQTTVTAPVGSTADTTPTFQWGAVAGAGRYILHVETTGGSVVIREDNLTGTSFTPSSALASGSYRVWVKAISADDNVTGIWSDPVSFTITAVTDEDAGPDILLTSLQPELVNQGVVAVESSDADDSVVKAPSREITVKSTGDAKTNHLAESSVSASVAPVGPATDDGQLSDEGLLDSLMQDSRRLLAHLDRDTAT